MGAPRAAYRSRDGRGASVASITAIGGNGEAPRQHVGAPCAGNPVSPHRHADVEELHLLQGELMIGDRKVYPGDYNRAEAGTIDHRV